MGLLILNEIAYIKRCAKTLLCMFSIRITIWWKLNEATNALNAKEQYKHQPFVCSNMWSKIDHILI